MQRSFPRRLGFLRAFAAAALAGAVVFAYALPVQFAHASFATVDFTTSTGGALSSYAIGDELFATVTDANRNTDSSSVQSVELTLSATASGDVEPMTVANGRAAVETGANTGVFRNTVGYTTASSDGTVAVNDNTLEVNSVDSIVISYTDPAGETVTFDYAASPLSHVAREGGHIDDGSSADDPTGTSCADSLAYLGTEASANFNDPANGAYIPVDRADWDFPPSSKAGVNDGPTTSNITTENSTYESNKSITAGVTNLTGCHGWTLHEFEFKLSPFTASTLTNIDVLWRGMATRDADTGLEPAGMNDLFLLVENRSTGQWQQVDVEANTDVLDLSGPPYTNVSLTSVLASSLGSYVDTNGVVRLLVAAWDATDDTVPAGGLYTDYVRVTASGNDTVADTITVSGGAITGTVWNDRDRDGTFDSSEPGLENVAVSLLDSSGTVLVTDRTDADGDYGFLGFPAGTYRLRETDPSGFVSTTSNDLGPITLAAGQVIASQNFGDAQQLSTTGLTTGYTLGTFAVVFAGGLGLLFGAPYLAWRVRSSRQSANH